LFDRKKFLKKNGVLERKEEKKRKKNHIKRTHLKRTLTHTQKLSNQLIKSIMDESWEELKRNAILLGSWIALIRASTYIFGAFQPQH